MWSAEKPSHVPTSRQRLPRRSGNGMIESACRLSNMPLVVTPGATSMEWYQSYWSSRSCRPGMRGLSNASATSCPQQSSVGAVPQLAREQFEEPRRGRLVLERNVGPGCLGQEGPVLLPSRIGTQEVPGLGEAGPFEMADPRSSDRFFEGGLAEHLYRPLTPSPEDVLCVPPRMKREPAAGEDKIERVLVWPDEALTEINSGFEQLS